MTYRALMQVCGAEAHMLPWQHTSIVIEFCKKKFAALIVSYIRSSLKSL